MSSDGGAVGFYQGQRGAAQAAARRWRVLIPALAAAAVGWALPAAAELPPGATRGRMCVQPLDQQRGGGDCGPVDILLLDARHANVRVSDIVYRLELDRGQVDVILMHGTMQIDGFTADYAWQGRTLKFSDAEKGLRYQIHFDPSKAPPR